MRRVGRSVWYGRDALFDHLTDNINVFARLDITIPDISLRCVAEEDASDGDERAWLQV